jgi:3-deoxy-7-phosphoheptulonate synthase
MNMNDNLARLRGELDQIDDGILELVERRLTLCRRISLSKGGSRQLKLSPARQRAVVARLQDRASTIAAPAVAHVWRELMAHGVRAQSAMRILIPDHPDRERMLRLVRELYGSAAPVEWVGSEADATARALSEEAIAVLPATITPLPKGLIAFDLLRDERGRAIARLAGRVGQEAVPTSADDRRAPWRPSSWRAHEARQQPSYRDPAELDRVERRLAARAPLVELNDIDALKRQLAKAARGEAILIQGGDCVETSAEHGSEKVQLTADLLLELGQIVGAASGQPIVHVGRIAGQYAKPRSAATEMVGGVELPVYRGDGVNGSGPTAEDRAADPRRLLQAHDRAVETMRQLWDRAPSGSEPVYASHEALLLNVEQAMTHYDELTGRWWAGSGHMLWIGDRTRQLEGAHVEYARGIANPIGLKCGPGLEATELLRLIDRLDPDNEPGRLTLIPRLGREKVAEQLPAWMSVVRTEGRNVLWCVDPMHGNTRIIDGRKTRLLADIAAETAAFHDIAAAEGVWPGGVHLELTGTDVLECTGGKRKLFRLGGKQRYRSGCDPRLNPGQARELAEVVAQCHSPITARVRKYG